MASAATINVGPGQTIASGIAAASTGDTVLVAASTRNESIVLNKSVTVKADGVVTLRPGGSRGIDIQANNATVDGFTFVDFSQAAGGGNNSSRTGVTIKNCKFTNAGAGIWVWGINWTLENIILHCRMRGGEDYMNAFGSGHTFRRIFCYGVIPSDLLEADGSYKHNDCIQTWTAGGAPGLKDTLIEECIFTDFAQGTYIHNEDAVSGAVANITVRNNVFWGVDFPRTGGVLPSHGTRLTGPGAGVMVVKNNLYKYISNNLRLGALTDITIEGNIVMDGGAVYSLTNMTSANVKRGTLGNLMWANNNMGDMSGAPDKTNVNPQVQNSSAKGLAVIGPDGIPWTADDAWRPMNSSAAGYGPQVTLGGGGTPPDNTVVANNDTFTGITEDAPSFTLNVLSNDSIVARAALLVVSVTTPSQGGSASITGGGTSLLYTPKANWSGSESFTYVASDGEGASDSATVTVTVTDVNDPPTAVANTYSVATNSSNNSFTVLANDSFAPDSGETLTIASVTAPNQGGTATINAGTTLRYTPQASFSGSESFSYTISDGRGGSATANVTVTVTAPVNNAPNAVNDSYSGIQQNSTGNVLNVRTNDTDADGDSLTITSRTTPNQGGSATISSGSIVYAPAANFSGTESFSYTISDGKGGTDTASVSISVVAAPNNVPNAVNDSYSGIQEDSTGNVFNVRANDTDSDDDTLTITSRTTPSQGGTASISSGNIVYAPKANFSGSESFSYTISDGKGGSDTATVTVTVAAVNDAPVAGNDSYTVAMNSSANAFAVKSNDTDAENDTLSITDLTAAANGGTVSISGSGLSYTPAANYSGADSFTYTVSDGKGGTDTATVTVTVTDNNRPPVATADAFTVSKNSSANSLAPLANDSDPDSGDTFSLIGLGVPNRGGSVSIAATNKVTYSPAANYVGTEAFSYTIRDSHGATTAGQVTITVKDTSPSTRPDWYKVRGRKRIRGEEPKQYRLSVLKNDVSNSETPLTLTGTFQDARAIYGAIALEGNDILYTPAEDYLGNEVFLYTVRDGLGQTATGEVTVEVTEDIGSTICESFPAILVQMAELYADFDLKGNDIDTDGIPDDFMLEAMQMVDCFDTDSQLGIAIATAYQINLNMLDSEANALLLTDYREAIAAMATMNTAMQGVLNQALDVAGLTLSQTYVSVSCDDTGMCMPQPVAGSSLLESYQLFEVGRGPIQEPFSGAADIDHDGFTNVEEYERVVAAGGSRSEYAAAVTDPLLDGSAALPGAGGGGGGGCFIATAAYGTPLASQIDVFRTIRDRQMLGNGIGAAFVDTYYRLSPPLARLVADYPAVASLVRIALWPIVVIGKAFLAAPMLIVAAALALFAGTVMGVRRRRLMA